MSHRDTNLLWLKDLLEHLAECRNRLEWVRDAEAMNLITDNMLRDLERCQQLCEGLRKRVGVRQAA